jgi:hypothetical protein
LPDPSVGVPLSVALLFVKNFVELPFELFNIHNLFTGKFTRVIFAKHPQVIDDFAIVPGTFENLATLEMDPGVFHLFPIEVITEMHTLLIFIVFTVPRGTLNLNF